MSNFGENLKQIRVVKGISQGKLAETIKYSCDPYIKV